MRHPTSRPGPAFLVGGMLLAFLLLPAAGLQAQVQTKDQQKCTDIMNLQLRKVAKQVGKQITSCIRNHAKGRPFNGEDPPIVTVEQCLVDDFRSKIQKQKARTQDQWGKRCTGDDKDGTPKLPPWGVTDPSTVNYTAEQKEQDLIHDLFGSDLDAAGLLPLEKDPSFGDWDGKSSTNSKNASRCQQQVVKAVEKCQDTKLNALRKCKRDAMNGRPGPVPASAVDLTAACLDDPVTGGIPDARGKIARKCTDPSRGIEKFVQKHCVDRPAMPDRTLADLFPGCSAEAESARQLASCLDRLVECRVCLAANVAGGLGRDCDDFDDGIANNSCRFNTLGQTVGVNTHYASGGSVNHDALARLAEAGVSFIRNDLTWASVEKEVGVYDFVGSGFDELVDTCETLGLRILFILDYGNPLYGESRAVVDEEGRRAFAAFAAAAASRYGGRGHSWEIWNEPNLEQFWSSSAGGPDPELYAELVRSTAPALRAADPDGPIVVGAVFFGLLSEVVEALGLGISGAHFLETVAATGVLSLADEVTLHLYRPGAPESVASDIQAARDLLEAAGYPLPVSSGEWGYSTYDPNAPPTGVNFLPAVTRNRQASYLARMLLSNYRLGFRRSVIFKDLDKQDPDPGDIEDHWGLMTRDLTAKPSYFAVSTLTELLGDAGPPETLSLGAGEHGLRFRRPDGSQVIALWAEQTVTWSLRAQGPGAARVLGRDGAELTPAGLSDGAQLTVEPDDGPIYLVGDITVASVE